LKHMLSQNQQNKQKNKVHQLQAEIRTRKWNSLILLHVMLQFYIKCINYTKKQITENRSSQNNDFIELSCLYITMG